MTAPIVWLACRLPDSARLDLTSARGYGEIRSVFTGAWPSAEPLRALDDVRAWVRREYRADLDFIMTTPLCDPLAVGLILLAINEHAPTCDVRWLRWDRRTDATGTRTRHGYYTPVEFNLGG